MQNNDRTWRLEEPPSEKKEELYQAVRHKLGCLGSDDSSIHAKGHVDNGTRRNFQVRILSSPMITLE